MYEEAGVCAGRPQFKHADSYMHYAPVLRQWVVTDSPACDLGGKYVLSAFDEAETPFDVMSPWYEFSPRNETFDYVNDWVPNPAIRVAYTVEVTGARVHTGRVGRYKMVGACSGRPQFECFDCKDDAFLHYDATRRGWVVSARSCDTERPLMAVGDAQALTPLRIANMWNELTWDHHWHPSNVHISLVGEERRHLRVRT